MQCTLRELFSRGLYGLLAVIADWDALAGNLPPCSGIEDACAEVGFAGHAYAAGSVAFQVAVADLNQDSTWQSPMPNRTPYPSSSVRVMARSPPRRDWSRPPHPTAL
jgi:hypothetical protein